MVLTLRLPDFCVYPRVLTIGEAAGECGASLLRSDSEDPLCRLCPFKRPAGVQWPTATSNPKPPVAAHGRSWLTARPLDQNPEGNFRSRGTAILRLQVCPKNPRLFWGTGGYPRRIFGCFLCVQKVTAGCGGAKPPLVSRHSAEPNDCSGGASAALGREAPLPIVQKQFYLASTGREVKEEKP